MNVAVDCDWLSYLCLRMPCRTSLELISAVITNMLRFPLFDRTLVPWSHVVCRYLGGKVLFMNEETLVYSTGSALLFLNIRTGTQVHHWTGDYSSIVMFAVNRSKNLFCVSQHQLQATVILLNICHHPWIVTLQIKRAVSHTSVQQYYVSVSRVHVWKTFTRISNLRNIKKEILRSSCTNHVVWVLCHAQQIQVYSYQSFKPVAKLVDGEVEIRFNALAFSECGTYIMAIGDAPKFMLSVWDWEKGVLMASVSVPEELASGNASFLDGGCSSLNNFLHQLFLQLNGTAHELMNNRVCLLNGNISSNSLIHFFSFCRVV